MKEPTKEELTEVKEELEAMGITGKPKDGLVNAILRSNRQRKYQKAWHSSEKGKDARKRYHSKPESKEKRAAYNQRDEVRERQREYHKARYYAQQAILKAAKAAGITSSE